MSESRTVVNDQRIIPAGSILGNQRRDLFDNASGSVWDRDRDRSRAQGGVVFRVLDHAVNGGHDVRSMLQHYGRAAFDYRGDRAGFLRHRLSDSVGDYRNSTIQRFKSGETAEF